MKQKKVYYFWHKHIVLVLILILMVSIFAACGGGGEKPVIMLEDGSRWSVVNVSLLDTLGSGDIEIRLGYVFLRVDFKCIDGSTPDKESMYVTDSQGSKYTSKVTILEMADLPLPTSCPYPSYSFVFVVPKDRHGFTLHCLGGTTIDLGN